MPFRDLREVGIIPSPQLPGQGETMPLQLPTPPRLALTQAAALPHALDAFDHVVVLLPAHAQRGAWPAFPHAKLLEKRFRARHGKDGAERMLTELEDARGTRVAIACVKDGASAFEMLTRP